MCASPLSSQDQFRGRAQDDRESTCWPKQIFSLVEEQFAKGLVMRNLKRYRK